MRLTTLRLDRYGPFLDASVPLGPRLTLVVGPNEAGKSTLLEALADLIWGIPHRPRLADLVPRAQIRVAADLLVPAGTDDGPEDRPLRLDRTGRGLYLDDSTEPYPNPWGQDGEDRRRWWLGRFGLDQAALRAGGGVRFMGPGRTGVHRTVGAGRTRSDDLTRQADQSKGTGAARPDPAGGPGVRTRRDGPRAGALGVVGRGGPGTDRPAGTAATAETSSPAGRGLAERRRCLDDAHRLRGTSRATVLAEDHIWRIAVHEEAGGPRGADRPGTTSPATRSAGERTRSGGPLPARRRRGVETLHAGIEARAADRTGLSGWRTRPPVRPYGPGPADRPARPAGPPRPDHPAGGTGGSGRPRGPTGPGRGRAPDGAGHPGIRPGPGAGGEGGDGRRPRRSPAARTGGDGPPGPARHRPRPRGLPPPPAPGCPGGDTAHHRCRQALGQAGAPDAGTPPPAAAGWRRDPDAVQARTAENSPSPSPGRTEQATAQDASPSPPRRGGGPALLPVLRTRRTPCILGPPGVAGPDRRSQDGDPRRRSADTTAAGAPRPLLRGGRSQRGLPRRPAPHRRRPGRPARPAPFRP